MEVIAAKRVHLFITVFLLMITLIGSSLWFIGSPFVRKSAPIVHAEVEIPHPLGKRIIVHLDTMILELHDGTTTEVLPIITKGKPGSYYETIGGLYLSDYKDELHLSTIGHVYMPYSVHLFGNYFIHGIPYYPNGEEVSSAYSGGCIRLSNDNAKKVYDFVEVGTPILVTQGSDTDFEPTPYGTSTLSSIEMTNMMVATISLEALTQDNQILDTDGGAATTRKALLPRLLLKGDGAVAKLYTNGDEKSFVDLMNQKAKALGLTNTTFTQVTAPVTTTFEDYSRFMTYISSYKSYLRTITN